ncbi:ArhGEF [Acrasis kona]
MSTSPTTNVSPISLDQSMDNQSYNNGGNDGSLTSREYDDMRQDAIQVQQIHEENLILTWLRDFELIDAECENQSLWMVLRGGVVLCKLMHVMFPGSIRMDRVKYKVDNDIISELNLNLFFDACKVVGLTGLDTMRFTHQDLVKNNKNVLACLLVLFERSKKPWNGPVACSPATVPTPRLKKLGSFPSPSYFEDRKSDTFVGSNNPLELVDKLIEDLKNVESSVSEKLSVRSLGISDMKDITDEQKEELTYLLSVNQKIKWLDMSNLHLSDLFVRDLAINMVSKKTGIERLDLSQNMDIGESARASLLKLLEESETLVELCLSSKKNEEWVDRFRMAERKRKQTISFVLKIL